MTYNIRLAKIHEAEALTELAMESKAFWGYSADFMQYCRDELTITVELMENPLFHYYLIEENNSILGFYAIEKLDESKVELDALFVYPKYMGKGVGKTLINHAKTLALELGVRNMLIQGEPNAAGFYENIGAKKIGKKESGSIPGRFLPIFEIRL